MHSLQVKVILSNRLPPFVVLGGQEAIGQPHQAVFVLFLGSGEHPEDQYDQNDDHRHSHQVWQNRGFQSSRTGVWRTRRETYVSFSLPTCYVDFFK